MPSINIGTRFKDVIRDRVVELSEAEFGISEVDTQLFKFESQRLNSFPSVSH